MGIKVLKYLFKNFSLDLNISNIRKSKICVWNSNNSKVQT